MRWVKLTLPPRARRRWLLMTTRLSMISLAGTARTLVAVGTVSEVSMFATTRAAAPRRIVSCGAAGETGAGFAGVPAFEGAAAGVAGAGVAVAGVAVAGCGGGGLWGARLGDGRRCGGRFGELPSAPPVRVRVSTRACGRTVRRPAGHPSHHWENFRPPWPGRRRRWGGSRRRNRATLGRRWPGSRGIGRTFPLRATRSRRSRSTVRLRSHCLWTDWSPRYPGRLVQVIVMDPTRFGGPG